MGQSHQLHDQDQTPPFLSCTADIFIIMLNVILYRYICTFYNVDIYNVIVPAELKHCHTLCRLFYIPPYVAKNSSTDR